MGKFLGPDALAAVGSSFTLMTFLTSILLGLCMGSGAFFSIRFGERDEKGLREGICASFLLILVLTILLNIATYILLDKVEILMNIPPKVWTYMRDYLAVIFCGIFAEFLYNYFASLLRSVGNSIVPLVFLAVSAVLNIGLDIWFVVRGRFGERGGRRGGGYRNSSVYFWDWDCHLFSKMRSVSEIQNRGNSYQQSLHTRYRRFLRIDVRTAIRDESGDTVGAGDRQQLRRTGYGGICRCCKD